jgi:hypothetical protein
MSHYVWAVVVSGIAVPATLLWVTVLDRRVARLRKPDDEESSRVLWLPITMGIVERAIYTILIGWNVSGAAGFIGAWVTIKAIGGWARWGGPKSTMYTRSVFTVGLLGSALSAIFGLAGGLIILAGRR